MMTCLYSDISSCLNGNLWIKDWHNQVLPINRLYYQCFQNQIFSNKTTSLINWGKKKNYFCCYVKLMEYDSFKAVTHLFCFQQITWDCLLLLICQSFAPLQIKLVTKSLVKQNSNETGVHGQLGRDALSFCFCWGLLLANKMPS